MTIIIIEIYSILTQPLFITCESSNLNKNSILIISYYNIIKEFNQTILQNEGQTIQYKD